MENELYKKEFLSPREYHEYYYAIVRLYKQGLFSYDQAYAKLMDVLIVLGYPTDGAETQVKTHLLG
jgi:hypothetical protein